ncbi:MAG: NYN domain-containing protein [Patescibacteria group bacterium]
MPIKRCVILIDGSNFYFKLKDLKLHNLLDFDFSSFALKLAEKDKIIHATYYTGKIRTDGTRHTQRLFDNQRKLLAHLRKHNFNYSLGYLLKSDGKFHEKGVDVNIAVDILVAAYENICDRIIIVSSDTDLLPAVKKAKEKKKIIEYVGFSHMRSHALINNCSKYTLLTKKDLLPFVKTKK